MNGPNVDWQDVAVQRERLRQDLGIQEPAHYRVSIGLLMLAYVMGLLTVCAALWWGYQ